MLSEACQDSVSDAKMCERVVPSSLTMASWVRCQCSFLPREARRKVDFNLTFGCLVPLLLLPNLFYHLHHHDNITNCTNNFCIFLLVLLTAHFCAFTTSYLSFVLSQIGTADLSHSLNTFGHCPRVLLHPLDQSGSSVLSRPQN